MRDLYINWATMFLKAAVGLSTKPDPVQAAKEAANQALAGLSENEINLAIVFSTLDFAYPAVFKSISNILKDIPLVGCSTLALISKDGILKHGLGIMAFHLPMKTRCSVEYIQDITALTAAKAGELLGEKLASTFKDSKRDAAILFMDGLINTGYSLIQGLQRILGKSFPLIGASASDNLRFLKTYLYYNSGLLTDACIGILLGENQPEVGSKTRLEAAGQTTPGHARNRQYHL